MESQKTENNSFEEAKENTFFCQSCLFTFSTYEECDYKHLFCPKCGNVALESMEEK